MPKNADKEELDEDFESEDDEDFEGDLEPDEPDDDDLADVDESPSGLIRPTGAVFSARRRVEEYLEMKRAAKELSDLEDYDFE